MLVGVNSILLFCAAFFTGIAALFVPKVTQRYRLMLVFAGAYLFFVTLIHLLPDIFFCLFFFSWRKGRCVGDLCVARIFFATGFGVFFARGRTRTRARPRQTTRGRRRGGFFGGLRSLCH